jgi:hypothetical protein
VPNVVFPAIGAVIDVYLLLHLDGKAKLLGVIWLTCGVLDLAYLTRGFRRPPPEMEFVEDYAAEVRLGPGGFAGPQLRACVEVRTVAEFWNPHRHSAGWSALEGVFDLRRIV